MILSPLRCFDDKDSGFTLDLFHRSKTKSVFKTVFKSGSPYKYRLEVYKMKKSKISKLCQDIGLGKLFLRK